MKTNDYLLITATAGYSYLFYQQNAGINFLVFTILFAAILLLRKKELLIQPKWTWALLLCLVSAVGVFITSSALSIIANCFSLLLLSAFSFNTRTSFIFSFLFSLYSLVSSAVWIIIDLVIRATRAKEQQLAGGKAKNYKGLAVLVVLIIGLIFFALYKEANPLFAENTKWINLDFISLSWVAFTIGGFFLMYALFYHKTIKPVEDWENNLAITNPAFDTKDNKRIETERFGGVLLFVLLNLMLLVLNIGDVTSIWFNAELPKGYTHSDFVHNGVGMIILSILIATGLIMFLYRKSFTEIKNSKLLKFLIYAWIFQNLLMLFSTSIRNQIYIHDYNFTYKRIGVYIWLCLAAIGLITAFVKVLQDRSNWYLVRSNFAIWFTVLSFSSLVNWDLLITRYNLSNKPLKDVDFYYLFSLSDSNIPELTEVARRKDFPAIINHIRNYQDTRSYFYKENYINLLKNKIYYYMRDYTSDWQSWDLRDKRNIKSLIK
ncbi:MAG: DUF4153 domain-containing protein [Bacteroidia bacterium]